MSHPAVTVLMAVHNTDAYLQDAIESVRAQSLANLELVIVDDGSTDDSWPIISAAAARDHRIGARRRATAGGASRALNEGLAVATAQYITRQDGDDVSLPTRLEEQVAFLEGEPTAGAVGTQATLIDRQGKRLSETSFPINDHDIQSMLIESMCFVGPTVMARRSAFARAGLWFDDELSGTEDYDFVLRLSEVARLHNLDRPLYLYRQHGASVSHRQRPQQLARKAMAVERAVRRRHGENPPLGAWKDVARDYLRAAVVAHASDVGASRSWIETAAGFYPGLADDSGFVEQVIRRHLKVIDAGDRPRAADALFADVLPRSKSLSRLRKQLVAEFHLLALVEPDAGPDAVSHHLWPAVRSNPVWLLKRDVLAAVMKNAMGRARGVNSAARP
jgi:glycosyltransferase involved in cell wall biosynthesis